MPVVQNTMQWETVGIPIAKGVDLNTRHRLIDAGTLAKAENAYYDKVGGPAKRRGHKAFKLYNAFMDYTGPAPDSNLYGYGLVDLDNLPTGDCVYPQSGSIKEILVYGDKELAWDGWRMYEPVNPGVDGKCKVTNAYLPLYSSFPTAKTSVSVTFSCAAQTSKTRVIAYIENNGIAAEAYAKVYDTATGSLKFTAHLNHGANDPQHVRTVNCGEFLHVLVSDSTDEKVYCYTIHELGTEIVRTTEVVTVDPLITCPFDIWKFNEDRFLVAGIDTDIKATWMNANGTVNLTMFDQSHTFSVTGTPINLAICVHPVSKNIGIFYDVGVFQRFKLFDQNATELFAAVSVSSFNDTVHLAIAPSYVDEKYSLFHDRERIVYKNLYNFDTQESETFRHNVRLASKACRVGNVPFVWTTTADGLTNPLQTTYRLLDGDLSPVGKAEYTTAVLNGEPKWLPSMNYIVSEDGTWNTTKFFGALVYTARLVFEDNGDGTNTTFGDNAVKFYTLDFTPDKLSYDEAGKCLYIAGAQLWSYDGETLREANFGSGVDDISVVASNSTGALTNNGVYRWRIDLCYRNAQNEECRAISFLTDEVTMGAADDTATITFRQPVTNITNGYYLIWRNESSGTQWYLVNNRITDPVFYDATAATIIYVDEIADSALLDNERHPADATGYIQPVAAPACEFVTFGQDRLWVSGGEMLPGEIWPSRLFSPGQTPAFSWVLGFYIDRTTESITGISFQADYGIAFKKNSTYIFSGKPSGNIFDGSVISVQLALSDRGCVNYKSILRLHSSVVFQSDNGYKTINAAGQMADIGMPVETARGNCVGAVLVKIDEHARFYQSDEATPVFDYRDGIWTTFVFNTKPSAAAYSNRTGMAVLARNNELLYEDADAYKDGDFTFHYTIKTSSLAREIGGFQAVRRVYCMGEKEGIPPAVTIRIYHNNHKYWSEQVRWDYSDDLNTTLIGDGVIGDNFIGDTTSDEFRDDSWGWRMRLEEQKCENVAIEITDKGRINSNKWIPVAFAIEVGTMGGLQRLSNRTFTKE